MVAKQNLMGSGDVRMSDIRTPAEVAVQANFWTISIQDLDVTLDRITARAHTFEARYPEYVDRMRQAGKIVQALRDELLALNYDANRKGKSAVR